MNNKIWYCKFTLVNMYLKTRYSPQHLTIFNLKFVLDEFTAPHPTLQYIFLGFSSIFFINEKYFDIFLIEYKHDDVLRQVGQS